MEYANPVPSDLLTPDGNRAEQVVATPESTALRRGISVVIPAKDEELCIGEVIETALPLCDEIVVVDGHSRDLTVQVAQSYGVRVVYDNRKGKGDAIRVGAAAARYDITVFIDADGSHDPADIPRLVQPIKEGKADMVIGSRGKGGSDELHGDIEKLMRMVGSDLILIGINLRWKQNLTDSQNGYRAIRTMVVRSLGLVENITTIEQEMTMKCLRRGCTVTEVPTHEYARKHGKSVIRLRKVWFRYVYSFVKYMLPGLLRPLPNPEEQGPVPEPLFVGEAAQALPEAVGSSRERR